MPNHTIDWSDVVDQLERLDVARQLSPSDRDLLEDARQRALAEDAEGLQ